MDSFACLVAFKEVREHGTENVKTVD